MPWPTVVAFFGKTLQILQALQALLRHMTQTFLLNDSKQQKAVMVVGRQTMAEIEQHLPENDVYVFNEFVQVCMHFKIF